MAIDSFPPEVVQALGHYVYRLMDPRNGEIFYVGRGRGDRVFAHARGVLDGSPEGVADPKLERIREIKALGMEVHHIIHRHRMSESAAKEVEAALIDAYPGLTNRVIGEDSRDRGTKHVDEIVLEYGAEEFILQDKLVLISIGQLWRNGIYEAVRALWNMSIDRASCYPLVLARVTGLVRGAYRPTRWWKATRENNPELPWDTEYKRWSRKIGFDGEPAEQEVWDRYVGKRVPEKYLPQKGAISPFRYLDPD